VIRGQFAGSDLRDPRPNVIGDPRDRRPLSWSGDPRPREIRVIRSTGPGRLSP
jgi:hypothetical protein